MTELHRQTPEIPITIGTADAEDLSLRTKELARDARDTLAAKVNDAGSRGMSALGKRIDRAADLVAEKSEAVIRPGAPAVQKARASVHTAAQYLEKHDPRTMMTDVDGAVQRHPYRAIAIGAACGWVVGRFMR